MKKMMNILSIFALLIICISFTLPNIMLKNDEGAFELIVYKEIASHNYSVEAEDIYLVKAIHDIAKSNSEINFVSSKDNEIIEIAMDENNDNITQELKKMSDYNIIKNQLQNDGKFSVGIIDKYLQTVDSKYTIRNVSLKNDEVDYELEIEKKSGKILNIAFDEEDLPENYKTDEILKNFVKYLGLDVIDDWKMEDGVLKSEKAELIVLLIKNKENYRLTINSNEILVYYN